ncbi:hypothetical protein [Kitasatospora sp. NPDC097643]|uniref:hypothetical protein n=1 Tax=Kitasatospora sp. NPDC097643 TaxID=3157230 RepID=UPI00331A1B0C
MAPLPPDPCSRMRTWIASAEDAVSHDHRRVDHDVAGLDQLRAQPNPDPVRIAAAEAGLEADRARLSHDEHQLSDLQRKYDLECGRPLPAP